MTASKIHPKPGRKKSVREGRNLLHKERERLIVESMPRKSLLEVLSEWEPLDEEFPDVDVWLAPEAP